MNYRHIYHAGSFADVMKHVILIVLLKKLKVKDKPFTVLDAFAGIGIYDLNSTQASKTLEHENGIGLLLKKADLIMPAAVREYLDIITDLNNPQETHLYPGSPYIAARFLREADELIACELHPEDYETLKSNLYAAIHKIDAYNAIKAFLPPKTARGLVLLDPPFEVRDEFSKLISALKLIRKRFIAGMVMIWYPIKDRAETMGFYDQLKATGYPEFLKIEFGIKLESGMNKCGLIIANPPDVKSEIDDIMSFICKEIYSGIAESSVEIL